MEDALGTRLDYVIMKRYRAESDAVRCVSHDPLKMVTLVA